MTLTKNEWNNFLKRTQAGVNKRRNNKQKQNEQAKIREMIRRMRNEIAIWNNWTKRHAKK